MLDSRANFSIVIVFCCSLVLKGAKLLIRLEKGTKRVGFGKHLFVGARNALGIVDREPLDLVLVQLLVNLVIAREVARMTRQDVHMHVVDSLTSVATILNGVGARGGADMLHEHAADALRRTPEICDLVRRQLCKP